MRCSVVKYEYIIRRTTIFILATSVQRDDVATVVYLNSHQVKTYFSLADEREIQTNWPELEISDVVDISLELVLRVAD